MIVRLFICVLYRWYHFRCLSNKLLTCLRSSSSPSPIRESEKEPYPLHDPAKDWQTRVVAYTPLRNFPYAPTNNWTLYKGRSKNKTKSLYRVYDINNSQIQKMSLVGNFSTCSVCGKRRKIAKQLNKVLSKQNSIDVYLECKDCAAIPLWAKKQKTFDHYQ